MTGMVENSEKLYTAEELQQNFGHERYELIRGELCLMPSNNAEHGNKEDMLPGFTCPVRRLFPNAAP